MATCAPISIVIGDDHQMFVEAIRHLIERDPGLTVVGAANDGTELLALMERCRPDVALVDVTMPGPGVEAIARAARAIPDGPRLVALTMHLEPHFAQLLIQRGFDGYVIKDAAFEELQSAIRRIHRGETYVSSAVAGPFEEIPGDSVSLTPRELECLRAAAEGQSNKAIARHLDVSERTIKFHFENIVRKLGVNRRGEAVATGRRLKLI